MDPITLALAGGSLGMGIAGMMRKQPTYGYSKGDLDYIAAQRAGQIDQFNNQLAGFRSRFASTINQLGQNAFNRYNQNAQAGYAANGFAPNGGAFQSALARKAAELQDSENMTLGGMEHGDIMAVDQARGDLAAAQLGGAARNFTPPSADPTSMALGQMSSGLGSLAYDRYRGTQPGLPPMASPGMFPQTQYRPKSVFSARLAGSPGYGSFGSARPY